MGKVFTLRALKEQHNENKQPRYTGNTIRYGYDAIISTIRHQ